ncbi:MAG: prepilin peptidase [Rhodospirillaceae bacterium]|nr:prepilin peptidase [Rhodospirillaceae bacterium]
MLTVALGLLSYIDFKTGYLPDVIVGPLALAGLTIAVIGSPIGVSWPLALLAATINAGLFYGLRWIVSRMKGREAMGLGDVKLIAAAGLWLGPLALPYIMAVGGIATLLGAGITGLITRKPVWQGEMPLGPGLCLGIWGVFIVMAIQ